MPSRRAPWWMYLIAASFAAMFALFLYLTVRGPSDLGDVTLALMDGGIGVQTVAPDSQVGLAGLQTGDRIIRIDQHPIRSPHDAFLVSCNVERGSAFFCADVKRLN